jgi:hypothetical protein
MVLSMRPLRSRTGTGEDAVAVLGRQPPTSRLAPAQPKLVTSDEPGSGSPLATRGRGVCAR